MIYLDHAATTQPYAEVIEVMNEMQFRFFGNPSSLHQLGIEARKKLNQAKHSIAQTIGSDRKQIVFTASGTEANNHILKGYAFKNPYKTIVSTPTEHHSVEHCLKALKDRGISIVLLDVNAEGLIDVTQLKHILATHDVGLVSILYANNETGALQPIEAIVEAVHRAGALIHCDMVQVPLHKAVNVNASKIDFATFSAHKFHGPKGLGFFTAQNFESLERLIDGGNQEFKQRAGTENLPAIVATALALEITQSKREHNEAIIAQRAHFFITLLNRRGIDYRLNGPDLEGPRFKATLNIGFKNVDASALSFDLDQQNIHLSLGSACTADSIEPSHVLTHMKVPEDYLRGSLRFSLGAELSENDMIDVVNAIDHYLKEAA